MHKVVIMDQDGNAVLLNLTNDEHREIADLDNAEFNMGIMPAQDAKLMAKRKELREKYNNKIEELFERGMQEARSIDLYTLKTPW